VSPEILLGRKDQGRIATGTRPIPFFTVCSSDVGVEVGVLGERLSAFFTGVLLPLSLRRRHPSIIGLSAPEVADNAVL